MELTLNNLIFFSEKYNDYETEISEVTLVTDIANQGDDVYDLLDSLEEEFNVSFDNFDFKKYFLEEWELSKGCLTFGIIKSRKIEHELTIGELYEYMIKNRKLD
ncbi:DUF1493 family protein [Apibacter raozihei]|uniref:DUF1493 family protein n=1 Tax=Apibacter raozihei TaxID=2500547 RepID=UPI000FE33945|nr:DUF1493 family protein [Apibacter raozihei]